MPEAAPVLGRVPQITLGVEGGMPEAIQPNAQGVQFSGTAQPAMGATPVLGRVPQVTPGVESSVPEGWQPNAQEVQFQGTAQPVMQAPELGRVPQVTLGVQGGMPEGWQPNASPILEREFCEYDAPTDAQEIQFPGTVQPALGAAPVLGSVPQATQVVIGGVPEGIQPYAQEAQFPGTAQSGMGAPVVGWEPQVRLGVEGGVPAGWRPNAQEGQFPGAAQPVEGGMPEGWQPNASPALESEVCEYGAPTGEVQFPGTAQPGMGAMPVLGGVPQMTLGVEGGMPEGWKPNAQEVQFPGTVQPVMGAAPALGRAPQAAPVATGGMQPNAQEVQFPGTAQVSPGAMGGIPEGLQPTAQFPGTAQPEGWQPYAQEVQFPGTAQPAMGASPVVGRGPQVTPVAMGGMPEGLQPNAQEGQFPGTAQPTIGATPARVRVQPNAEEGQFPLEGGMPEGWQPSPQEGQFPGTTQPEMGVTLVLAAPVEGGMPEGWQPNASPALESEFREYGAPTDAQDDEFPGTAQPAMRATPALGRVPQMTPAVEGGMPEGWQPNPQEVQFPGAAKPEMGATPVLGLVPQVTPVVEGVMPEGWQPREMREDTVAEVPTLLPGMTAPLPLVTEGFEDSDKISRVLDFLDFVGKLKEVKRAGWVRNGIDGGESVADHTYRMTSMCLALNPADGVDQTKCMKMALVKDLGVSITGDVVTAGLKPDKITKEEKFQKEQDAIHTVASSLGGVEGAEIVSLWTELQNGVTPEAMYVHDMSILDMVMQADTYEQAQAVQLDDFFDTTSNIFKTSLFQSLDAEVRTRRADRTQSRPSRDRVQY